MRELLKQGGMVCLLEEGLPSVVASTSIFANAPATTQLALVTLRGAGLTLRSDGVAATAGANGIDYPSTAGGDPHSFPLTKENLDRVRAIQNGGTTTGWISYWRCA